jgi:hypothetical protein
LRNTSVSKEWSLTSIDFALFLCSLELIAGGRAGSARLLIDGIVQCFT